MSHCWGELSWGSGSLTGLPEHPYEAKHWKSGDARLREGSTDQKNTILCIICQEHCPVLFTLFGPQSSHLQNGYYTTTHLLHWVKTKGSSICQTPGRQLGT